MSRTSYSCTGIVLPQCRGGATVGAAVPWRCVSESPAGAPNDYDSKCTTGRNRRPFTVSTWHPTKDDEAGDSSPFASPFPCQKLSWLFWTATTVLSRYRAAAVPWRCDRSAAVPWRCDKTGPPRTAIGSQPSIFQTHSPNQEQALQKAIGARKRLFLNADTAALVPFERRAGRVHCIIDRRCPTKSLNFSIRCRSWSTPNAFWRPSSQVH